MSTLPAKLNKQAVVDVYSKTAPLYDLWAFFTESRARRIAIDSAGIRDGESILEVAVGTGLTFRELLKRNPNGENHGIELTEAMLNQARKKAERLPANKVHLEVGDAYNLPHGDQQFDLLVNNYMFDLLPEADFDRVLAEFRRVLKPGGRLLLVNMAQAEAFGEGFYEAIYRFKPEWMGGCRGVALSDHVRKAGFERLHRQRTSQLRFPSEIITAYRSL